MGQSLMAYQNRQNSELDSQVLSRTFSELFGRNNPRLFYAPGRVNLIGEHTDYNEGFVLPIAIEQGTLVVGLPRTDRYVRAHSLNESETVEFDLNAQTAYPKGQWINYIEGVARSLEQKGFRLQGADLLIASNIPVGAGLSSSAALENASAYALLSLSDISNIDRVQLALAGQAAEHQYVGTQCGIMDQLVTALGQKNQAVLIDCRTLKTEPIPINLNNMKIVICDSRVKHALASSAYNQRVAECHKGVEFLRQALPDILSLRDVDEITLQKYHALIPDEIILKRVRHVVSENARTLQAAEALKQGDTKHLGQLMFASHQSLKNDYEVSCQELDTLVDIATNIPGVVGARMTGGGFGGCTINLVEKSHLQEFMQVLTERYREAFGQTPHIYITQASDGVREISAATIERGILSQSELNQQLKIAFTEAFEQRNLQPLLAFSDSQMPTLITTAAQPIQANLQLAETRQVLPASADLKQGNLHLTVSREFGIRLYYQDRQLTTDIENIPTDYPWFMPDPDDPQDIAGYATRHVARGSRGESPWPESQWPQIGGVQQGEQNWPHQDAAFGPYRLELIENGKAKAIRLSLPDETQTNAYGVIPRGVFSLNAHGSVVMALQHKNQSSQGLSWSPWFVLGFAVPKFGTMTNPSTILAFPDPHAQNPMQEHITKVWNYMEIEGRKIAVINPHAKTLNEPFKKLYSNVNWSVIAFKGADFAILTRSVLRHEEQFFPFLEHGRYFIEVEHTGPRVGPGQTSTVIVQHDLVPVHELSQGKFDQLNSEKGQFEADVHTILKKIVMLEKQGQLLPNYPSTDEA
jgi:galactokinase